MIDSAENNKLRERFNPEGSLLRQHQLRMLEMLKYIDQICKKHNIKYWLCSGTLIGAVRHGGFIPWDDDVDIEMLREDYKKFVKVMADEPQIDYVLQTHETDKGYFYPYAKLRDLHSKLDEKNPFDSFKFQGVYIDIFIMEHSSSLLLSRISAFIHGKMMSIFIKQNTFSELSFFLVHNFLFSIFRYFAKLTSRKELRHTFGTYFFKPRYLKDIFPLTILNFEGSDFYVPKNYHAYLSKIYGDYNMLPNLDGIKKHVLKLELFDQNVE